MATHGTHSAHGAQSLLRRREVERRVGVARSTIYLWIARGEFPAPVALGRRCVAWPSAEVDRWIAARIAQGRRAP